MLPQELKQTLLGGQQFCRFVCDIENEDSDAVKEGMIVFASDDAKDRLLLSPNWLLEGKWMENSFFKQVRTSNILRFPSLLVADSNSFLDSSTSCLPLQPMENLSPLSMRSCLTSQSLSFSSSGSLSSNLLATTSQPVCSLTWRSPLPGPLLVSSVTSRSPSVGMLIDLAQRTLSCSIFTT